MLVRYEDLLNGDDDRLKSYLQLPLCSQASSIHPKDGPDPLDQIPSHELIELVREVDSVASNMGYQPNGSERKILAVQHLPPNARQVADMSPSRCAILVPVGHHIEPECESALQELERRGYAVRRVHGFAAIDQARNHLASARWQKALKKPFGLMPTLPFIPIRLTRFADTGCRSRAVSTRKRATGLAIHVLPGTDLLQFGEQGGLTEIQYAATGFLHVRREVYSTVQHQLNLPTCNDIFGIPTLPFFQPLIRPHLNGHWYLAEDFAFSERVRQCGFRVFADTSIRLWHLGRYGYSWEDAGGEFPRFDSYSFHVADVRRAEAEPVHPNRSNSDESPLSNATRSETIRTSLQ